VTSTLHLERPAARINVINAVITVVLNLILVPTLGIVGAALALAAGRTIRLVQYWRLIGNDWLVSWRWRSLLRVTTAAVVMGVIVFLLGRVPDLATVDSRWEFLVLLVAGVLAYCVALVASGAVERREIQFLRSLARERLVRGSAR
jgi:O-antigen/teichoic acid export membrane protein